MDKKKILGASAAAMILLILLGAGCTNEASDEADTPLEMEETQNTLPPGSGLTSFPEEGLTQTDGTPAPMAEKQKPTAGETIPVGNTMLSNASLSLQVEALGGGKVKLTWDTDAALTDANRFIIVRSDKENPELTPKSYWIRQYRKNRETVWGAQPVGTFHYRICLTENNQNDTCVKYGNDVSVEVK